MFNFFHIPVYLILRQVHALSLTPTPFWNQDSTSSQGILNQLPWLRVTSWFFAIQGWKIAGKGGRGLNPQHLGLCSQSGASDLSAMTIPSSVTTLIKVSLSNIKGCCSFNKWFSINSFLDWEGHHWVLARSLIPTLTLKTVASMNQQHQKIFLLKIKLTTFLQSRKL